MFTSLSHRIYKIIPQTLRKAFTFEGFISYILNIQWVAIWKIVTTSFSLITTMIVARLLGPEKFGTLSYVISITGLFGVIGSLGIGYIVYGDAVKYKNLREEILGSSIALTLITGCIAFIFVLLYTLLSHEPFFIKSLITLMALSFFTAPFSYLHVDFLKDKEGKFVAITQSITTLTSGILKIVSIFFFSSLYLFITVLIFENIFAGLIYLYQIRYIKKRSIQFVVSKERMWSYFTAAIPLTALAGFNEIYYRIDQILLKNLVNVTAVGLYATAVRLTEIWYIVPNILIASLFPALASASLEKEGAEYKKRFRIFLITLLLVSLIIVTCTIIFGKHFIAFIYGPAFIHAAIILSVYITSLPGSFVSMLIMQDMFLKDRKWSMVIFSSCTASINILFCLILIPHYTALGAALATAISYNITPFLYYGIRYIRK